MKKSLGQTTTSGKNLGFLCFTLLYLKQNIECSGKTVKNIQEIDAEVMIEREVQNGWSKNRSQKLGTLCLIPGLLSLSQ